MSKSHSYSQLSTAYRCGQLYKYLYVDGIKSTQPDSGDMKFGTAIHLAIECMLTNPEGDYMGLFELFWGLEREHNNKYGRYGWQELRLMGHKLLQRFERLHAKKFVPTVMEERLYGSVGDIKVEGTPDFVGMYKGKKAIVDFKTSGSVYSKDKIKVSEQLYLYAHLASKALKFNAEQIVYVVFVKGPNPSIQCISENIRESKLATIIKNVRAQGEELNLKIKEDKLTRNYGNCIIGANKCSFFENCHGTVDEEKETVNE